MADTSKLDVPFAFGVVGSLPRPQAVKDMLPPDPGPESADAARSKEMNAAVSYAIALQETAGLDLISDRLSESAVDWNKRLSSRYAYSLPAFSWSCRFLSWHGFRSFDGQNIK
ncbi:MAG TPA: hypothetical protein EYO89_00255 [Candidatus Dadabacteria bacterium]|nr:hypothetical protein [Candidatus Dadabacteria bacterium]